MVVFDEDNALLKKLTFEQPTTWLEMQLARDPNLWNRAWVIEQLARRTSDSVAAAALARADTFGRLLSRASRGGGRSGPV